VVYESFGRRQSGVIQGRFGSVGWIKMRFVPRGPFRPSEEPQGDCRGNRSLVRRGVFKGKFSFHGEEGFSSAKAVRVPGLAVRTFREVCRGESAALGPDKSVTPFLLVSRKSQHVDTELLAYQTHRLAGIEANVREDHGGLKIQRSCWNFSRDVIVQEEASGNVVIRPDGPPFAGTAEVRRTPNVGPLWSGDLRCDLPGRGTIELTGAGYRVQKLVH
jgi:hypothetical protein